MDKLSQTTVYLIIRHRSAYLIGWCSKVDYVQCHSDSVVKCLSPRSWYVLCTTLVHVCALALFHPHGHGCLFSHTLEQASKDWALLAAVACN